MTTGFMFLVSLFLSPIFLAIPGFATAPALIIVGFFMASSIKTTALAWGGWMTEKKKKSRVKSAAFFISRSLQKSFHVPE